MTMFIKKDYSDCIPICSVPKKLEIYDILIDMGGRHVYMCPDIETVGYTSTVVVSSDAFLSIWEDSLFPFGIPREASPDQWKQDRRLNEGKAEEGFSWGIINPVPFATVNSLDNGKLYLTNGCTRTLWLLIHGARAFPVACPHKYVKKLRALAGIELYLEPRNIISWPCIGRETKLPRWAHFFKNPFKRMA